jgi:hypothetical protein
VSGIQRRSLALVFGSVIACGLLVAAASVVPLVTSPGGSGGAGDLPLAASDPSAYALQATGEISHLAALPGLPAVDLGALGAAEAAALAAQQQLLEKALADLDAALVAAGSALPQVPAGYAVGGEAYVDLPAAQGYPVPSLPVPDLGVGPVSLPAVSVPTSPVGKAAGSTLDGVLAQLEGLGAQLDGVMGDTPLGGSPLGGLPIGGLPVGLPVGGSPPSEVQGADDAVQPDEQGALAASVHAESALGLTVEAYRTASAQLQALLQLYADLADRVEEAVADLDELRDEATAGVQEALAARLAGIRRDVAVLQAEALALVEMHADAVAGAQGIAADAVAEATALQSVAVGKAGDDLVRALEQQMAAVESAAAQRKEAIDAIVQGAAAELGPSAEAQEALQALQAAAASATLKLERDAKAQVAALAARVEQVEGLVAESQAGLQATAAGALAQVEAAAAEALAGDAGLLAFLKAQATSYGELMEAREASLALEAVEAIEALAQERSEELLEEALEGARAAEASLGQATGLVKQVQSSLASQVGQDLEYLTKVGEDYGRVPTEDRKARAEHWSMVALELDGVLDLALGQGRALELLAKQALDAADKAQAEVSALE